MVGWHHHLNGHEFEQTPGDSEKQGKPSLLQSMGCNESDMTQQLNNNKHPQNQGKYLQNLYLTRVQFSEYTKSLITENRKKKTQFKNGQMTKVDISSKKTYS